MTIEAYAWGIKQKVGDPTRKLILLIICDHYNNDFGYAFPSQDRIAEFAECSVRTVQRHIKILLDSGLIGVIAKPNFANRYTIPAMKMGTTKCANRREMDATLVTNGDDTGDVRSLNNSYLISNKLDISDNTTKTYGDLVYQDHLQWLAKQDCGIKYPRPFLGKLREIIKGKSAMPNEKVYEHIHKLFVEVQANPKGDLQSYLMKSAQTINDRLNKPKDRVLTDQAKALMESNFQKIYKATKDVAGWGGLDYLAIREEYETAFKQGSIIFSQTKKKATADEILEYFGVK